jgi:aminopeptidase N
LVGFLDKETGKEVMGTTMVELKQAEETYTFRLPKNLSGVVPSFLRNFSAPVFIITHIYS